MKTVVLKISLDGSIDVQGIQEGSAESVEKEFRWLLSSLGEIEARGHKHVATEEVGVKLEQKV